MNLPAGEGLSVLYVLADEWLWRRDLLQLLGAKEPGRLDALLEHAAQGGRGRAAQVAAMGGELG